MNKSKKHVVSKILPWIILISMFICLIPSLANRISNEKQNKNIVMSVLYKDIANKVSKPETESLLEQYKANGITNIAVTEETLNTLVVAGEVTSIKYNVLLHKYDTESMMAGEFIRERCPDVAYDSHIVLAKREETKEFLKNTISKRYTEKDYMYVGNMEYLDENMDIYVFYDGSKNLWDYQLGYDESELTYLRHMGFNVTLSFVVNNYKNTEYLHDINRIVKDYEVKYLNLLAGDKGIAEKDINKKNYQTLADIINENNITLVVTENDDQLSNQHFLGYDDVFYSVVKSPSGSHKVLRGYETYDDSQIGDDGYSHRVSQFFNSAIDRNIRFFTITQIFKNNTNYNTLAEKTFYASLDFKTRIENEGFTVGGETKAFSYSSSERFNFACCAVIMIMAILIMMKKALSCDFTKLTYFGVLLSVFAFFGTYLLYSPLKELISLYPTVFCLVISCFAMTSLLSLLKRFSKSMSLFPQILLSLVTVLASILIGTVGMGSMLSGIDYYINNEIFRGIKLSLIVPLLYSTVLYYLMFFKDAEGKYKKQIASFLNADIKVYKLIFATGIIAVFFAIIYYYILRSGNVSSISSFEQTVRTTLTKIFPARPRTKEFLIGYPSLVLLVYYMKKTNLKSLQWVLTVGTSILTASVTNSFCHVFTDFTTIVQRTLNGLFVGVFVCIVAYVLNLLAIKVFLILKNKAKDFMEMSDNV